MADIYPRASQVVIWLGPERENALVLRELDALGSRIDQISELGSISRTTLVITVSRDSSYKPSCMALDMPNALTTRTGFRTHSSKTPDDVFKSVILDHVSTSKDLRIL